MDKNTLNDNKYGIWDLQFANKQSILKINYDYINKIKIPDSKQGASKTVNPVCDLQ
jgi:hypothetical protein